jgi:hypothetical protein
MPPPPYLLQSTYLHIHIYTEVVSQVPETDLVPLPPITGDGRPHKPAKVP